MKKTMSMNSLIPTMQSILYAPNPEELRGAVDTLNATLMTTPVKQVLSQSGQFVDIVEQVAYGRHRGQSGPRTAPHQAGVSNGPQRLADSAPSCPPCAHYESCRPGRLCGIVEDINTLNNYDAEPSGALGAAASPGRLGAGNGIGTLSQKLSELLIRKMLPEVVRQKEDYALLRQFHLWSQLMDCRKYGMEDLAVYFLQADRDHVKVLLPPAMEYHNAVKDYYGCARTLAVLYYQIPVCQRDALFRSLYKASEGRGPPWGFEVVRHTWRTGRRSGPVSGDAYREAYPSDCISGRPCVIQSTHWTRTPRTIRRTTEMAENSNCEPPHGYFELSDPNDLFTHPDGGPCGARRPEGH